MHFIRYFPYFMVVINAVPSLGDISTSEIKWLCAEPTCSEPISTAKTVKKYLYPDRKDKVTFSQNEDAVVLKKPADGSELWWVKIGDKTGVAHKSFLKELSTKKKVKELVSAGQGVKVTKTPKYADIEGTRIPIDVDDLPSESNDGVTVTSEDEAETELPSNLVASETQSVVKPSTTAPTVQLPVNGLSQAATVDAKKDAPPELAPEHRPEEEPGKTESPELQMPLNFDNIPSVGLSNETMALPSGISSESGGPVNDTEATATEAPSPLIASTPTAVEPEFSANIPTEATSVNSTPSEIEDFTEQAVLIESVQRADSVDLGETKVTVENPDSEQMNSHQTVDTPSSENSDPEGTKNSAPSAENDASLNGTQPDSQQIGENPSVSDNQSDSPSNLDKKEQSSHDPVTINTSDSQPISKEPFHPPAGPIDLIQVNESNPAAPREEQESSSAVPSPKIAEPTSTGTEASLVSPPTPKPQPLRNLLTFGASKLGSIQQNGEVPPLQRQESFNPEIAESLPASSEANNAHSEGYTPPEGTQATTTSPFPSGNESSGDPPPQYQDSQSLNPGMMASTPASPEENSHSEMYSPPEDTKASMTSPLSSGNGNSADPPAQYQDSQSFNPEIMMPPPASAEENAQSEIYSLPEDAQASKTSELPSYSAPQMSQITDPPAVGVVHSESIEATIAEDSPSHEPELSSSWWPPEFLDPLLEALQEYLPASLFSPSCCSQETVVDVLDQPKPVEEEKFCEKEECDEEPPRVPLSMPSSLRLERAYESSSDPSGTAWLSYKALFLMGFTSILVLLFTLGHYYIENLRRDVELASKYNDVSGQLFTEKREKEILEEKLEETQDMLGKVEIYENEIGRLKGQIVDLNDEKASLIKKEKDLTKKYAVLMKNYEELRRVLSESKQKGERFSLMADIKKLEENAVEYVKNIASLKEQLVDKQGEIKQLNQELHKNNELKVKLERDLEKAHLDKQEAVKTLQNSITELQKSLEDNKVTHARLEDECTRLKKELEQLAIEKELAESSLQKAHGLKSSESLSEWLDSKRVRASLLASEKEVLRLSDELTSLKLANSSLQEKETFLENEMKRLNENYEGAEKEKIEALTRLQVLSDYFKEKETQLQDELGMKEALWVQKQSDDDTLYEQMRSLREENQRTKQVNETLKKEIIEQETSYKKLVSTAEEKAYENWVALRHAERRLKEAQMEASQLRARLTSLEASGEVHDDKFINKSGPLDTNGDLPSYGNAASPPFMLYPGDFLPPPPLLNLSGGGIPPPPPPLGSSGGGGGLPRPPPVGRISSPPLDFTPPPPLVNYGMFSPPPPPDSSANSHVLHKPQPREPPSKRHHKDSQSSNHSDSAKDKPVQRNKR